MVIESSLNGQELEAIYPLPDKLAVILHERGITTYRILQINISRWVLKVELRNGKTCLLKYTSPDADQEASWLMLKKERQVMQSLQGTAFCPALIEWGDDYYICDFIEGQTLRELLRHYQRGNLQLEDVRKAAIQVFDAWHAFRKRVDTAHPDLLGYRFSKELSDHLFDRVLYDLDREIKLGRFRLSINTPAFLRNILLKKRIESILHRLNLGEEGRRISAIHGDFHWTNCLITETNCVIIDYSDACYGTPEIEALYMLTHLWRALHKTDFDLLMIELLDHLGEDIDIALIQTYWVFFKVAAAYSNNHGFEKVSLIEKAALWQELRILEKKLSH